MPKRESTRPGEPGHFPILPLIIRLRGFESDTRAQQTDHEESRADKGETQIRFLNGQIVGRIEHDDDSDRAPSQKA